MSLEDEARPPRGTGNEPDGDQTSSSLEAYRRLQNRADLAVRCAWLTVHADLLYEVDTGGQLSAQLLDLRDLLLASYDEGRWAS